MKEEAVWRHAIPPGWPVLLFELSESSLLIERRIRGPSGLERSAQLHARAAQASLNRTLGQLQDLRCFGCGALFHRAQQEYFAMHGRKISDRIHQSARNSSRS